MNRLVCFFSVLACLCGFDACRSSSTEETSLTTTSSTHAPALTNLCDLTQRAFELPYGSLPNPDSIPGVIPRRGLANDSIITPFLQQYVDTLAWKNFIALNWIATETGIPDSTVCFGLRDGTTVWEHWMPGHELFESGSGRPKTWASGLTATGHPKNSGDAPYFRTTKLKDFSRFDPERHLVPNKHGLNTLYEVYYNRPIYDYVVAGKLYNLKGQRKFVQQWPALTSGLTLVQDGNDTIGIEKLHERVYMPIGGAKDTVISQGNTKLIYSRNRGAMMIKSAWMVLTKKEAVSTYHVRRIVVAGKSLTLGLVALHIAFKTAEAPRWVWSTFEHTRNAPSVDQHGQAILKPGVDYSYFDETSKDTSLYNKPLDDRVFRKKHPKPTVQLVRVRKEDTKTEKINDYYHSLIRKTNAKSVWEHYRLVGTQWPSNNPDPFQTVGPSQPAFLSNALMETYHQNTSTCMGCHAKSRILANADSGGYFADFVWGLALRDKMTTEKSRR